MAVEKVCEHCGIHFKVPNRRSDQVRFCSRDCKTASGRICMPCAGCGKLFERVASELKGKKGYCSQACYFQGIKGRKNAADPNSPRYYKTCELCAKEFRITATRRNTARFCSKECQGASPNWRRECSERQQGDKSWRWSGGLYQMSNGYIRHKRVELGSQKITMNHRLVVLEAMLKECPGHPFLQEVDGKWVLSSEIEVHHIDRDRANNDLSNLLAVTKMAHANIHHRNTKPNPWECWPSNPERW